MADTVQQYQLTIGMEVHAELTTRSKMFCSCSNNPDTAAPNVHICPVCMGHPGTLPVPNASAIAAVIKTGLAVGCVISESCRFDRKNYFYPDLPKGYQITQYFEPLCQHGSLMIPGTDIVVRVKEIHIEEDTAKLVHASDGTLADYNRAGVPLMELVTQPDLHVAADARKFCEELQLVLRYIGVSDADMEKGHMRCEANISVRPSNAEQAPAQALGTKVEVKNLNSFKAVERAILYEEKRQIAALEHGEKIVQETRGWDDAKGETYPQRSKEQAHDYRYFPEPDIPPVTVIHDKRLATEEAKHCISVENLRTKLPELPRQRRERFVKEYGISQDQVELFTKDRSLGEYFEHVASELGSEHDDGEYMQFEATARGDEKETSHLQGVYTIAANYLINELPRALNEAGEGAGNLKITPENFSEFVIRVEKGVISSAAAKIILLEMVRTGDDPDNIIREKNLAQISDVGALGALIDHVIAANGTIVEDYKKGKQNAMQFLVGQVMRESKGKANPKALQELIREKLGFSASH